MTNIEVISRNNVYVIQKVLSLFESKKLNLTSIANQGDRSIFQLEAIEFSMVSFLLSSIRRIDGVIDARVSKTLQSNRLDDHILDAVLNDSYCPVIAFGIDGKLQYASDSAKKAFNLDGSYQLELITNLLSRDDFTRWFKSKAPMKASLKVKLPDNKVYQAEMSPAYGMDDKGGVINLGGVVIFNLMTENKSELFYFSPDSQLKAAMKQYDMSLHDIMSNFEERLLSSLYPHYPSTRKLAARLHVSHTCIANKVALYKLTKNKQISI